MERPAKMQKVRHQSEDYTTTDFQPYLFTTSESYPNTLVSTVGMGLTFPMATMEGDVSQSMAPDHFNMTQMGCNNGFDFSFTMGDFSIPLYSTPPMPEMPPPSTLCNKGSFSPLQSTFPNSPVQNAFLSPASQSGVWTQSKKRSYSTPARSVTPVTEIMAPSSPLTSQASTTHSHSSYESPSPRGATPTSSVKSIGTVREFLPKVQQILTRLLCDIRFQREEQSKSNDQTYHHNHSKELFPLVLSLWTNLRSLCTLNWSGKDLELSPADVETRDSTLTLGFLTVSIILEMYKSIAISSRRDLISSASKKNKEQHKSPQLSSQSQIKPQQASTTKSSSSKKHFGSVSPTLDSIVRLTVMECHMMGLEQVFEKLDSIKSCRELLPSCNVSVTDFQSLRIIITGIVDDWKKRL